MNYKKIALYGLLLTTAQSCLTVDYRTIGRRTFKTIVGIPTVTGVMHYAQSPSTTKDGIAYHEAGHAVIATVLGEDIKHAHINKIYGCINNGQVEIVRTKETSPQNFIKICVASVAAMQQSKKQQKQQRFIEQELNLPLSNLGNNQNNINYGYNVQFSGDMTLAHYLSLYYLTNEQKTFGHRSEETVNIILPQLYQETAQLTQQHEPEIKSVAEALIEKGFLSGDEIKKLMYPKK